MLAEALLWATLAVLTATSLRLQRPVGFWSLAAGRPLVLARVTAPARFRNARPV